MMKKVFLYVRAVQPDAVLVDLADMPTPIELPEELFEQGFIAKLRQGVRIIGRVNRTRIERKLIIAGPFEVGTSLEDEQPVETSAIEHKPGAHAGKRLFIVGVWYCRDCQNHFCDECQPVSEHVKTHEAERRLEKSTA
jgi:hypothetical protein